MNSNQKPIPQYSQHPSITNLFITDIDNNIGKEITSDSDITLASRKKFIDLQDQYAKKYSNYALGIKVTHEQQRQKKIIVIYDCDISAIPLSKVKFTTPIQQISIFYNLYQIYGFLNKEKIQHRNLKPNNIILYNNQLLLTDFSFIMGQWVIDKINFLDENKDHGIQQLHKDNMYPYLCPEIAEIITKQQTYGHKQDALKNRVQSSVQKQDQFAIAIMMLEVFIPLVDRNLTDIPSRKKQIQQMNLSEFSVEEANLIKDTIYELLEFRDFNQFYFEDKLNKIKLIEQQIDIRIMQQYIGNYKVNQQAIMNQDNYELAQQYLKNENLKFDFNLLYCCNNKDIIHLLARIRGDKQNENLENEIQEILKLYSAIDKQQLDVSEENINKLRIEQLYIILNYLDQKIEELQNNQNQLQQKPQIALKYFKMKKSLEKYYEKLNKLPLDQFKFNQPIHIEVLEIPKEENQLVINYDNIDDQFQIHPQTPNRTKRFIINNQETLQNNLKHFVKSNVNLILYDYFEINKCLLQSKIRGDIYIHQDQSNVIFLGQYQDQKFKGEVMQFEEKQRMVNKQVIKENFIKHFVNVETDENFQNIKAQQIKSQIFYFQRINSPRKFQKNKEYFGEIQNGKEYQSGNEINYIENLMYSGQWENGQKKGQGTLALINNEYTLLNTPYKWIGNFDQNKLNGDNIKTYLFINNNNKEIWSEGRYENGFKQGTHIWYTKNSIQQENEKVKLYRVYFLKFYNKEFSFKWPCN